MTPADRMLEPLARQFAELVLQMSYDPRTWAGDEPLVVAAAAVRAYALDYCGCDRREFAERVGEVLKELLDVQEAEAE